MQSYRDLLRFLPPTMASRWRGRPAAMQISSDHAHGTHLFTVFVVGVLLFIVLVALYRPDIDDPLLLHQPKLPYSFLTASFPNPTLPSDPSVSRTGEDFSTPSRHPQPFLKLSDIPFLRNCDAQPKSIDCSDPAVRHAMMRAAIERFPNSEFYTFGKSVPGINDSSCDMAWRFRPSTAGGEGPLYKDYRRFVILPAANCSFSVTSIGDYHSGANVRRRKQRNADIPVLATTTEEEFSRRRYLVYGRGGDHCKSMNQYLWSFLCSLGEARYLNRTLVVDLRLCLSGMYTSSGREEEGKDFRYYFDLDHLRASVSVMDQEQFWTNWASWHRKHGLTAHYVDDVNLTPMELVGVNDSLIMRGFEGKPEADSYWYRVCEGETEGVIQRPWDSIWKSPRLIGIVSAIANRLKWDFDALHVVRGEKLRNAALWPNLAADTSPDSLMITLQERGVEDGRSVYVATNEKDGSFFDPLKDRYRVYLLDDFRELWEEGSEWYAGMRELGGNSGAPEFDGYMRVEVDTEVYLRGRKRLETFNDLTGDCKDGINTCKLPT